MKSLGVPVSIEDVDRYELPLDNPRDAVVSLIKDVNQLEMDIDKIVIDSEELQYQLDNVKSIESDIDAQAIDEKVFEVAQILASGDVDLKDTLAIAEEIFKVTAFVMNQYENRINEIIKDNE